MALVCISLMISDIEHLLRYLPASGISSWKHVQALLLLHYLLTFAIELHEVLVYFGY